MTDAHCHISCGDASVREFLVGRDFIGVHPWDAREQGTGNRERDLGALRLRIRENPRLCIGEIGLDRLKDRTISKFMRDVFEFQLRLAAEFHRPVVLHGAKCWGQVVSTIRRLFPVSSSPFPIPSFLFHGFSRSAGLIPDIVALNGFISVGPAVLNDHAVNYRELVKKIPVERLLVETDRTPENAAKCPDIREVTAAVAELRGMTVVELETIVDGNADAFICYNTI